LDLLRKAVRRASLALLAALVVTPLAQITMRGVFNVPLAGAEELARYFLVCLTFLAAPYVTQQGGQIRMEELQALVPPRPRWMLQLAVEVSGVALFGVLFVATLVTITRNLNSETPVLQIPFWLFFAPLAAGSLMLAVETLAALAHTWRSRRPEEKHTVLG
jgi:TRAP-type C4-dicarboxylate transport system permease small subunit